MHNMLIVALMVFGCVMINPFIQGSESAKVVAATEQSSSDNDSDDQDADGSDEDEEAEEDQNN